MSLAGRYWQHGCTSSRSSRNNLKWLFRGMRMNWTANKVTLLRVLVGFAAVSLFGRGAWANLAAVGLAVAWIALDALDGHIARARRLATPVVAQIDSLGERKTDHVYFEDFAGVG